MIEDMASHTLLTAEQFDQLPADDGVRRELLDGELIEMSSATPEHNRIWAKLLARLETQFARDAWGIVLPDTEFEFGPESRLRPDIALLSAQKWAQVDRLKVPVTLIPDVAVEIVSPSESARDLDRKMRVYLKAGVTEVWIIYPEGRHMYLHALTAVRHISDEETLESSAIPDWSMPLSELFAGL